MLLKKHFFVIAFITITISSFAQKRDINTVSKNDVLEMSIDELANYELDEIMHLMDIVGASSIEELYELLLNKNVTSASKSNENLFDSPLSSTVLSHDEIIASGATSLEEALRLVPGMIVREKTNGNYDVHIRGNDNLPAKNMLVYSENMNTLVMINGRPVFNYSHGGTLWETLPISFEDIDKIEVVRGPSSALYGPNALSGVINIITQNITNESALVSGNIQAGSLNTYIGDIAFRKKVNNKLGFGITGNYEVRDREREELLIYNGEDEDGNPLFTLDGNKVGSGYYSVDEIGRMYNGPYQIWEPFMVGDQTYDINTSFPNPGQSKERMGLNGYLEFTPTENASINLMAGYQNSESLTSSMGDIPSPYSTKIAETQYVDLRADIKDFSFQANYNGGTINYLAGEEGFELDNTQFSALAEYNFKLNKLSIRPGLSYQNISYDDSEHIAEIGNGYLNKKSTINIMAASARFDYNPTEKLRLVAALRAEKYNHPDDIYASWQFIGSYKINDNNIIRAVYSRANQSSFIVNTYSNYTWNLKNRPYPRVMQFDGDENPELKTMDMIELGYRVRPSKSILIDLEAFYTRTSGFGALMPNYTDVNIYNALEVLTDPSGQTAPISVPDSVNLKHSALDLISKQLGATISIDWVVSKKLVLKGNLTVQKTTLDNYLQNSRDEMILHFATDATTQALTDLGYQLATGAIAPGDIPDVVKGSSSTLPDILKNNYTHKATPSYFGGFSIIYRPTEKIEIYPQGYYYGDQTFENQYYDVPLSSKLIFNTKVSYKATKSLTVYVNGKNLLGNTSQEFAFMDETPMMILAGVHFKF
ncbi:TonB-dependent receptor plug domain-containing protein [Saccharicrinis aurantiacus]|uniref:TonB-dependent receptor plug domain-containing protein n=1 Tax=Saccharicrinis aurantiacus TaxID=1849719 RepID=UPI000838281C|nr:TonB-dependent receptor [Saccharicrinis aurantiacus]